MIDIRQKYQASLFVDAKDITPSTENVMALLETFRDKGFLPSVIQDFTPGNPPTLAPKLQLVTQDNEWSLSFAGNKIDVEKNPTNLTGGNLGDLESFSSDTRVFAQRLLERFKKKAQRLSLVAAYLLGEMTDSRFKDVYSRLFRPPPFCVQSPPFEWNWRSVSRVPLVPPDSEEALNVNLIINRVQGQFNTPKGVMPFDRIQLVFDINTLSDNQEYRFDMAGIDAFYARALGLHKELLPQVAELING